MRDLLYSRLQGVSRLAIGGHTRPDGDCVGACLGLFHYLKENYPEIQTDVYLEPVPEVYRILEGWDVIRPAASWDQTPYDLFISVDASDEKRLAESLPIFEASLRTFCVDHHMTNTGFADDNVVVPEASSASEVLYTLMDSDGISMACAEALYVGILCDTGCFRHSSTGKKTMEIAGALMDKGIPFPKLVDTVFYQKTYMQNHLLGRCLLESFRMFDGQCIISVADKKTMEFYNADSSDLEGVIDKLRITKGVEVALLLTQVDEETYKVSMRSNDYMDVASIAARFGGGGHFHAAGVTMHGTKHNVINSLTAWIEEALEARKPDSEAPETDGQPDSEAPETAGQPDSETPGTAIQSGHAAQET